MIFLRLSQGLWKLHIFYISNLGVFLKELEKIKVYAKSKSTSSQRKHIIHVIAFNYTCHEGDLDNFSFL